MHDRLITVPLVIAAFFVFTTTLTAQEAIAIRAGTLIDGRGGVERNVIVLVEGTRISRVESKTQQRVTYDLSNLTLLPGLIDTHVHIGSHFGKEGRASNQSATTVEQILYAAASKPLRSVQSRFAADGALYSSYFSLYARRLWN